MSWRTLILLLWVTVQVQAHSLHQSTAEAEWNAETKKLEVSLTVFINDLELALMRQTERLMSLEKTPAQDFDEAIRSYLAKTFVLTSSSHQIAGFEWVGREIGNTKTDDPTMTFYFELAAPSGLKGATLQHSTLCELFKDQSNLLLLRTGKKAMTLKFSAEKTQSKIELRD